MNLTPEQIAALSKKAAMDRVYEAANTEWIEFMLDMIWDVARVMRFFTTDDIVARYREMGDNVPDTHEWRALCPVMTKAAKMGFMVKTQTFRNSVGARRHGTPLQVWASKLYEGNP